MEPLAVHKAAPLSPIAHSRGKPVAFFPKPIAFASIFPEAIAPSPLQPPIAFPNNAHDRTTRSIALTGRMG